VITYGAVAWYDRVSHSHVDRILSSIQRKLLLYMTRACRTTSTAAMQVISGYMPIKLEVVKKALLTKVRRMEPVAWDTYLFAPGEDQSGGYLKKEKEKLEATLYTKWQQDWDQNEHGRTTYRFIPDVKFSHKNWKWFKPNRQCVYMITGYGPINETLFARNCVQTADCPRCPGIAESVEHMLFHCPLYDNLRGHDLGDLTADDEWTALLKDEEIYVGFSNYVTSVFRTRKNYLTILDSDSPPPRG